MLTPKLREDVVAVLLVRPESAAQLVESLSKGTIQVSDLTLDQRETLKNHPDRKLRDAAVKVLSATGGLPSADRVKVLERFASTAHNKGDAKIGKELFKKNCANCHKHSGEGQEIGPDLTVWPCIPKKNCWFTFSIQAVALRATSVVTRCSPAMAKSSPVCWPLNR